MGHKGGYSPVYEECTVCTAVWQKAPLGLKWHWMTKQSSMKPLNDTLVWTQNTF